MSEEGGSETTDNDHNLDLFWTATVARAAAGRTQRNNHFSCTHLSFENRAHLAENEVPEVVQRNLLNTRPVRRSTEILFSRSR